MFRHGHAEKIVGFNKGEEGVFIWRGILAVDVTLDRSSGGLTAFRKFFDEVVVEDFGCRSRLNGLGEEFGGRFCFFDAGNKFFGWWQRAVGAMITCKVVLLLLLGLDEWWSVERSWYGLESNVNRRFH